MYLQDVISGPKKQRDVTVLYGTLGISRNFIVFTTYDFLAGYDVAVSHDTVPAYLCHPPVASQL